MRLLGVGPMDPKGPRVHIYFGDGEGKTMAAFGLALRMAGHGNRVVVIQFMKGRPEIGEYKASQRLKPNLEIYQFGRREFVDLKNPDKKDVELAARGLRFAKEKLLEAPDMMVLDELGLAASVGLVDTQDVLDLVSSAPEKTVIVITGRKVPQPVIDIGDLVTEMREVRHPMRSGAGPKKGLEY